VIDPQHYTGPQKSHIYILCDAELVALKVFTAPEVFVTLEKTGIKPGTVFTDLPAPQAERGRQERAAVQTP